MWSVPLVRAAKLSPRVSGAGTLSLPLGRSAAPIRTTRADPKSPCLWRFYIRAKTDPKTPLLERTVRQVTRFVQGGSGRGCPEAPPGGAPRGVPIRRQPWTEKPPQGWRVYRRGEPPTGVPFAPPVVYRSSNDGLPGGYGAGAYLPPVLYLPSTGGGVRVACPPRPARTWGLPVLNLRGGPSRVLARSPRFWAVVWRRPDRWEIGPPSPGLQAMAEILPKGFQVGKQQVL